jgi:hypothetical protein
MGAIDRNGFRFEPEYSVIYQKGALHVYKDGTFMEEIPFTFHGEKPEPELIEHLINDFFEKENNKSQIST